MFMTCAFVCFNLLPCNTNCATDLYSPTLFASQLVCSCVVSIVISVAAFHKSPIYKLMSMLSAVCFFCCAVCTGSSV